MYNIYIYIYTCMSRDLERRFETGHFAKSISPWTCTSLYFPHCWHTAWLEQATKQVVDMQTTYEQCPCLCHGSWDPENLERLRVPDSLVPVLRQHHDFSQLVVAVLLPGLSHVTCRYLPYSQRTQHAVIPLGSGACPEQPAMKTEEHRRITTPKLREQLISKLPYVETRWKHQHELP